MHIQYYLIHNGDKLREKHMLDIFKKVNIDIKDVKWMLHPNRDEINDEFINKNVTSGRSLVCDMFINAQTDMKKGQICCTYKHYLCLKDIIENNYEYAVIIEDNIDIKDNVPDKLSTYIEQLNTLYPDWDILFDTPGWLINGDYTYSIPYIEQPLKDGQFVYPKSNNITNQCHGGTKCTNFYMIRLKCARKLYENFLPFNWSVDWYYNDLFRKYDIKSFWAEPPNVAHWCHENTSQL
jgi:GR25 family glycosyltransferase involved in LPS biosynthesis